MSNFLSSLYNRLALSRQLVSTVTVASAPQTAGTTLATLNDPFAGQGRGTTTYSTFGTVPPQLALSGKNVVMGGTALASGTLYQLGVLATSGDGQCLYGDTYSYMLRASVTPALSLVAFMGDSIMYGTGATGQSVPYILGYPSNVKIDTTYAIAGTTLTTANVSIGDLYDSTRSCVVVIERSTNDFAYYAPLSGATLYAVTTDLVYRYRTQGFRVVVSTTLPRQNGSFNWSTDYDQARLDYNALVRANSAGADAIADVASDPVMGAANAPNDNSLYGDGTHPTPAGHVILKPIFKAAIDVALALPAQQPAILGYQNRPTLIPDGPDYIYAGNPSENGGYNQGSIAYTYQQLAGDGYVQWTEGGTAGAGGGYLAGFCTNLKPTDNQQIVYGVFCDGGNGPDYNLPRGIPEPARSPQAMLAGDICRLTRSGSTITFTVNGNTNFVWTNASTAPVVFLFQSGNHDAPGQIKNVSLNGFAMAGSTPAS